MRSTGLPNRVHEDPRDIRGAYRGLCCAICEMAVKDYGNRNLGEVFPQ